MTTDDAQSLDAARETLLDAALPHVAFDGWSNATLRAAIADSGIAPGLAHAACPRGPVDLAMAFHRRGDRRMLERIAREDLSHLRFRDRIAAAVRFRLEAIEDKEAVRRGASLFALPHHAADGATAIWETVDHIWAALGDSSDDLNWYTKRATLSGVYSATLLYWLGDTTPGHHATWEFLDRRIDDVMQFERIKGAAQRNPVLGPLMSVPERLFSQIRPPHRGPAPDMPGARYPAPPDAPPRDTMPAETLPTDPAPGTGSPRPED